MSALDVSSPGVQTASSRAMLGLRHQVASLRDSEISLRLLGLGLILIAWELFGRLVDPRTLSYPTAVIAIFPQLVISGELPKALLASLQSSAYGFALAVLIGVPLGVVLGRYQLMRSMFGPYVNALFALPRLALIPVLFIWFGLGQGVVIGTVFLSAVFSIIIPIQTGVQRLNDEYLEVARSFSTHELAMLRKVVIPGALPFVFTGLRLGVGRAVVSVIAAELFVGLGGMGTLIRAYGESFAVAQLFCLVATITLVGVAAMTLVRTIEDHITPWSHQRFNS